MKFLVSGTDFTDTHSTCVVAEVTSNGPERTTQEVNLVRFLVLRSWLLVAGSATDKLLKQLRSLGVRWGRVPLTEVRG